MRGMTILVSGATGSIGGAVLARLREAGVQVRGGSRRPGTAGLPDGAAVAFDLDDPATMGPALDGVDAVFVYAATSDLRPFLDVARAAGGPRVVLLSSASIVGAAGTADGAIAEHHRTAEDAITASGLPATFVRGGYFATNMLRWAEPVRSGGPVPMPCPEAHLVPVHELDLADVAVAALTDDALVGRAPVVTGPQSITLREMITTIGRALGRSLEVVGLSHDQARQQMLAEAPAPFVDTMLTFFEQHVGHPGLVTDEVETITGHPARPFAGWAREHADDFR